MLLLLNLEGKVINLNYRLRYVNTGYSVTYLKNTKILYIKSIITRKTVFFFLTKKKTGGLLSRAPTLGTSMTSLDLRFSTWLSGRLQPSYFSTFLILEDHCNKPIFKWSYWKIIHSIIYGNSRSIELRPQKPMNIFFYGLYYLV